MASHTEEEQRVRGSERLIDDYSINDFAIAEAIVGRLVSGVGYLALTWSTVVLLGGFVGALQTKEFWFLTAVSLVLASVILDIYDYNPDIGIAVLHCFVRLLSDAGFKWFFSQLYLSIPFVVVQYVIEAALYINIYGPVATVVISMMRLIQHDYDGSDAANNGKLRAALFTFYGLALAHDVCFFCWFRLRSYRIKQLDLVSKQYGFDDKWGRKVLKGYFEETKLKYAKGLRLPAGWNLVAYAVGLLGSVSWDDNLSGVRMLDTFVDEKTRVTRCIRLELLSSRRAMQNLINMLGRTSMKIPDVEEIRKRAARIMADISSELRIAQFPGALQCVSSLLEASPQECDQGALVLSVQGSEQSSVSSVAGTMQANRTDDSTQRRSQLESLQRILSRTKISKIISAHKEETTKELMLMYSRTRRDKEETTKELMLVYSRTRREDEGSEQSSQFTAAQHPNQPSPSLDAKTQGIAHFGCNPIMRGKEELIHQGLLILEGLAFDEHNRREIVNTQGLLSKITPQITSQDFPRLASLVKEAQQLFNKAQPPASGGPRGGAIRMYIAGDRG